MKLLKIITGISSVLTVLLVTVAHAGDWSSGGGNAVVCFKDGAISSAELLDLYEARVLHGHSILNEPGDYIAVAKSAVARIASGLPTWDFPKALPPAIDKIASSMKILPPGSELKPIEDSQGIVLPKDCKLVQLARYEVNQDIYVNGDVWQYLDKNSRAALLVHELIYFVLRSNGETDSTNARRAVGLAFAGIQLDSVLEGLPMDATKCQAGSNGVDFPPYIFYSYKNSEGDLIIQFERFDERLMLTKTTAKIQKSVLESQYGFYFTDYTESKMDKQPYAIRIDNQGSAQQIFIGTETMPVMPKNLIVCQLTGPKT